MSIKKFLLLFCFICVLSLPLLAIEEEKISSTIEAKLNNIALILSNKKISLEERELKASSVLDDVFDYYIMSRIALGKFWKRAPKDKQTQFVELFKKKIKNSYTDKFNQYVGQKVQVLDARKLKNGKIELEIHFFGNDLYDIKYKFYKTKKGDWLVYDVIITGVSTMKVYKTQFYEILQNKSFDELLKILSDK